MPSKVRRILTWCDYPPDQEVRAAGIVLGQAELFVSEETDR